MWIKIIFELVMYLELSRHELRASCGLKYLTDDEYAALMAVTSFALRVD